MAKIVHHRCESCGFSMDLQVPDGLQITSIICGVCHKLPHFAQFVVHNETAEPLTIQVTRALGFPWDKSPERACKDCGCFPCLCTVERFYEHCREIGHGSPLDRVRPWFRGRKES